jgi:hypothetical protein
MQISKSLGEAGRIDLLYRNADIELSLCLERQLWDAYLTSRTVRSWPIRDRFSVRKPPFNATISGPSASGKYPEAYDRECRQSGRQKPS